MYTVWFQQDYLPSHLTPHATKLACIIIPAMLRILVAHDGSGAQSWCHSNGSNKNDKSTEIKRVIMCAGERKI